MLFKLVYRKSNKTVEIISFLKDNNEIEYEILDYTKRAYEFIWLSN